MPRTNQVLIFSEAKKPLTWCYFDVSPDDELRYYTAPYGEPSRVWEETPLPKKPLYVYDPQTQERLCYAIKEENLYEIPLQVIGKEALLNRANLLRVHNGVLNRDIKRLRDLDLEVDLAQYVPADICQQAFEPPPAQPDSKATTEVVHAAVLPIEQASAYLKLTACVVVDNQDACPAAVNNHTLYAWKVNDTWHYRVDLLGTSKVGEFDPVQHADAIEYLNAGAPEPLNEHESMKLLAPELQLTPSQQASIKQIISHDWPVLADMSEEEAIDVCRAVLQGLPPEHKQHIGTVNAFRAFLFPSTVNSLHHIIPKDKGGDPPLIPSVIRFIQMHLVAHLKMLGDTAPLSMTTVPRSANCVCGQLPIEDSSMRMIYRGLSDTESGLFQLILNYETQGIEHFNLEALVQLDQAIKGLQNPAEHPDYQTTANDLLAAVAAGRGGSQEDAQTALQVTYNRILTKISNQAFHQFSALSLEACSALNSDTLRGLKPIFDVVQELKMLEGVDLNESTQALMPGLLPLHQVGLLTADNVQILLKNAAPLKLAFAIKYLHKVGLLRGDNRQANFEVLSKHADPLITVAFAIKHFCEAGLLTADNAQRYFEVLSKHPLAKEFTRAIYPLHAVGLLTGEREQTNFEVLSAHADPLQLADAIEFLHQKGLLTGERGQINFEVLSKSADPKDLAKNIFMDATEGNNKILLYATQHLREDRSFVLRVIQQDGLALQFAAEAFKKDPEVVFKAAQQDIRALEYASDALPKDMDALKRLLSQNQSAASAAQTEQTSPSASSAAFKA